MRALGSKRGTNAAGISSRRRSRASTAKVDAPSVMERVPSSAGSGVVSPAARSSTKMVEKRSPPPAEGSHQSATSPLCKGGCWLHCAKVSKTGRNSPLFATETPHKVVAALESLPLCSHQSATSPDFNGAGRPLVTAALENGYEGPRASARKSSEVVVVAVRLLLLESVAKTCLDTSPSFGCSEWARAATSNADHTTGRPACKSPQNGRGSLRSPWEPPSRVDPCRVALHC